MPCTATIRNLIKCLFLVKIMYINGIFLSQDMGQNVSEHMMVSLSSEQLLLPRSSNKFLSVMFIVHRLSFQIWYFNTIPVDASEICADSNSYYAILKPALLVNTEVTSIDLLDRERRAEHLQNPRKDQCKANKCKSFHMTKLTRALAELRGRIQFMNDLLLVENITEWRQENVFFGHFITSLSAYPLIFDKCRHHQSCQVWYSLLRRK